MGVVDPGQVIDGVGWDDEGDHGQEDGADNDLGSTRCNDLLDLERHRDTEASFHGDEDRDEACDSVGRFGWTL